MLESDGELLIEWAGPSEGAEEAEAYAAVAVSDNQGLLAPHALWEGFYRQASQRGLLDSSGRGLCLVHALSQLLVLTIWPGERTEIVAFLGAGPRGKEKPISVRVAIEDDRVAG